MRDELRKIVREALEEHERTRGTGHNGRNVGDEYLTADEVIERYRTSRATLTRWDKDGYLKPRKLGRKSLYLRSEIEKLMGGNGHDRRD